MKEYENTYVVTFISLAYKRFLDDKNWKDRVTCNWGQSNLTIHDFSHMHHLVDSLEKVLIFDIEEATNGMGSPETYEYDRYCVMTYIMETVNSKSFKKRSREYAIRNVKHKAKKE
jgi:hypothetical protein